MIFNEIYSAYYNAVAKIITEIISGNSAEKDLNQIVCDNAFGESMVADGKLSAMTPYEFMMVVLSSDRYEKIAA